VFHTLTAPYGASHVTALCEAAALWAPPGAWERHLWAQLRLLPEVISVLGLRRLFTVGMDAAAIEEDRPEVPYYYLALLGTDPDHQGRGLGSAVLAPVLARCDREGALAVLDTAVERNVGFYGGHGFIRTRTLQMPRGGPSVHTLVRSPVTQGSQGRGGEAPQ
jgi:GNAT superfamily N-acetyltransferase